jgi:hypothetical protein
MNTANHGSMSSQRHPGMGGGIPLGKDLIEAVPVPVPVSEYWILDIGY